MAQFEKHFVQDLTQDIKIRQCGTIVFNGDNLSNVITVDLYNGTEPYSGGGSVSCSVICPDGATVPITNGSISGNTVTVTLTGDCFAIPGQIGVGVQVVSGDIRTTILKAIYNVELLETDTIVDPGSKITASVGQLVSDIENAVAQIPASDMASLMAGIAPTFSASTNYTAGAYVYYNGTLYRFTADHTAGSWTGTDATAVVLGNDVADLKSAVNGQIVIASKEVTKAGAKVSANGIIQYADQNKYRCFDVDAGILRQYNVMRLVLKNNTQYNMLAIFVLRDSTGAAVVTTGWMLLVDGIDIYNACFASRMTDAIKTVSITYIFSPDLVAGNAITGINELDYSFLCTKTDYALAAAVQTGLATVQNDIDVLNDAVFETISESIDQYSATYASGSANNAVKWVPVILPPKSTVTLFQQLVQGNSTDVVKLELWEMDDDTGDYSLSNTLTATSVTKVSDYMYTLNFPGFTTEKKTLVTYADPSSAGWLRYAVDSNYSCRHFPNELTEVSTTDITSTASVKLAYKITYSYVQEKDKSKKIVYVDANGDGDYLSVIDAVSSEPEGTVIYILPGVYDGTVEAFTKRIILIGTDRNQCIIRSVDGRYDYPAINGSCGYLENLTLYSQYVSGTSHEIDSATPGAYAFHCENEYGVGKTLEFHHCTLISDFCPGLGVGLRKDFHLILDDCILENRQILNRGVYTDVGSLGALYFHDSNGTQGDQYVTVKNCVLRSTLGKTMTPYQVSRETQNNHVHCDFIGNVLYDAINKYSNNIWYRNNPFNESTGIFEIEIGYGNSNSGLNNNT